MSDSVPTSPTRTLFDLRAHDLVSERPFTHPQNSSGDLQALTSSLRFLRGALNGALASAAYVTLERNEGAGRVQHVRIFNPAALRRAEAPAFVGFWGQQRPDITRSVRAEVEANDTRLIAELREQPIVLSYSSLQLSVGTWINLVLLHSAAAKDHFHQSSLHRHVAQTLSPQFYEAVRLHNGTLIGGLRGRLSLESTKYYDFSQPTPWYAARTLTGDISAAAASGGR